jgi:hypothetical protein
MENCYISVCRRPLLKPLVFFTDIQIFHNMSYANRITAIADLDLLCYG